MSFIASLQFASPSHHLLAAAPAIQAPTLAHALVAFAVAATGGLALAAYVLRNKFAPWALSLLHAALGATGFGGRLVYIHGVGGNRT